MSGEGGWPLGALGWLVSFTVLTMETTNGQRLRTHQAKLHRHLLVSLEAGGCQFVRRLRMAENAIKARARTRTDSTEAMVNEQMSKQAYELVHAIQLKLHAQVQLDHDLVDTPE